MHIMCTYVHADCHCARIAGGRRGAAATAHRFRGWTAQDHALFHSTRAAAQSFDPLTSLGLRGADQAEGDTRVPSLAQTFASGLGQPDAPMCRVVQGAACVCLCMQTCVFAFACVCARIHVFVVCFHVAVLLFARVRVCAGVCVCDV